MTEGSVARIKGGSISLGVFVLALWVRLRDLDAAVVLGDAVGPWLVAVADPLGSQPHTPIYGWGLTPPYAAILALADSLRESVGLLLGLHALAAPIAACCVLLLSPRAWCAALVAGAWVALDPGIVDTALSGSKGYLAPVWLGALTLGVCGRDRRWGPMLACGAWAMAAMNHPLAVCALPLLLLLPWRDPRTWRGGLLLLLLLLPRLLQLSRGPLTISGGAGGDPWTALPAFVTQGGAGSWVLLAAPVLALFQKTRRALGLVVCASLLATVLVGVSLGYLRDHHIRFLAVPMAVCLVSLPGWWALLPLVFLRMPASRLPPPDHPHRPGTLGLAMALSEAVEKLPLERPVVIDGAWVSGVPAAEPSAVMLNLYLGGWDREALGPGGSVVAIVSAERGDLEALSYPGVRHALGDRHFLALELEALSQSLCGVEVRRGGAWDGLAVLHPSITVEEGSAWWQSCEENIGDYGPGG